MKMISLKCNNSLLKGFLNDKYREEQANREAGMISNNNVFKELRSEPSLDKYGQFELRLNKSPEVSTSNTSPQKPKVATGTGKAQDVSPRVGGLVKSASQKTLPPNKLNTSKFNRLDRKNTLNSTVNLDPNSSVDHLNNSTMTVQDMRKTHSDNKEKSISTSKMYSTATSFGTFNNKAKPPISGSISGSRPSMSSNVGLISSPKGAGKTKININSSPVTVKKKT
jgi:hypothetical protein